MRRGRLVAGVWIQMRRTSRRLLCSHPDLRGHIGTRALPILHDGHLARYTTPTMHLDLRMEAIDGHFRRRLHGSSASRAPPTRGGAANRTLEMTSPPSWSSRSPYDLAERVLGDELPPATCIMRRLRRSASMRDALRYGVAPVATYCLLTRARCRAGSARFCDAASSAATFIVCTRGGSTRAAACTRCRLPPHFCRSPR